MGRSGLQGTPWHEVIKYDDTPKKKVSCRDCKFYDEDDTSCFKGIDINNAGSSNWHKCKYFILEAFADKSKKEEVRKKKGERYIEKPIKIDSAGKQVSDSSKTSNSDKIEKKHNDVQSFNYREIPEEIMGHFRRYHNGDQLEYRYCEGLIPEGTYEAFQQLCKGGNTEDFDMRLCQFANKVGINITNSFYIKNFRKALRKGMFMLLFSNEDYSLRSTQFSRLFVDAFVALLEKKKCFKINQ